MDLAETLKDPFGAGIVAACITIAYIHGKSRMNDEGPLETSAYTKPAILNAIMVYFIISGGLATKKKISTDPY